MDGELIAGSDLIDYADPLVSVHEAARQLGVMPLAALEHIDLLEESQQYLGKVPPEE